MKYQIGDLVAVEGWQEVIGIRRRWDGVFICKIKVGDYEFELPEENLVCKAPEPEDVG